MRLFAIKFKYRGTTDYVSAIFSATDIDSFRDQLNEFKIANDGIDRRTISWAGDGVPLTFPNVPAIIHANLDDFI